MLSISEFFNALTLLNIKIEMSFQANAIFPTLETNNLQHFEILY